MTDPRKATDVLLAIETQVNILLGIIRAQDLNIKVLSNKLSEAISLLNKQQSAAPKITVEAVQTMPSVGTSMPVGNPERNIPIAAENKLPQTDTPQGFRRTSRPETYAGDNSYLPTPEKEKKPESEVIVPSRATHPKSVQQKQPTTPTAEKMPVVQPTQGQIPVIQRCVDKNGKSIFLADVEITDLSSGETIFKTRTNGTGKWMASLGIGVYRVAIRKRESITKEKLEGVQDITVDGSSSPLELNMVIIK